MIAAAIQTAFIALEHISLGERYPKHLLHVGQSVSGIFIGSFETGQRAEPSQ